MYNITLFTKMRKRKIERSIEEEIEFQQQRRERQAENQRRRRQNAKKIASCSSDNLPTIVTEQNILLLKQQQTEKPCCSSDNNLREIRMEQNILLLKQNQGEEQCYSSDNNNREIVMEKNILLMKEKYAEKQYRYRAKIKNQLRLNINTIRINEIMEHYIGPMNISCIHCNAKHFAAEKVSNKGNSFHDCCNHGAVYLEPLLQLPHFLLSLYDGSHAKSNDFLNHICNSYKGDAGKMAEGEVGRESEPGGNWGKESV